MLAVTWPLPGRYLTVACLSQAWWSEASNADSIAALKALPIQLVVGRKDYAINAKTVEAASTSYGGVPYVILENAGHFIQEDAPETLVAMLQMFIQTTGGTPPPAEKAVGVPPPGTARM